MVRKAKKKGAKKKMPELEPTTTDVTIDPPPFEIDPPPFTASVPSSSSTPTPADIEATKQFLMMQRAALQSQIEQIEILLGFIASADDLAVRVAKIERFLGI